MAATIIDGKAISAQIRGELTQEVAKLKKETGRHPGAGGRAGRRQPRVQGLRRREGEGLRGAGAGVQEVRAARATPRSRSCSPWSRSSTTTPRSTASWCSCRCPSRSTRTRSSPRSTRTRTSTGSTRSTSAGWSSAPTASSPARPTGCIHLLKRSGVKLAGAEVVVVGRSNIVGKPVALLLLQEHATVTICHSKTRDLGEVCRRADVLVVAIGRPKMITADMVQAGRRRDRRRRQPPRRRQALRGRRLRRRRAEGLPDHPGPRRRGADDDRDADAQHRKLCPAPRRVAATGVRRGRNHGFSGTR